MDPKAPVPLNTAPVASTQPSAQTPAPQVVAPMQAVSEFHKVLMWTSYILAGLLLVVGIALGASKNNPGYYIGLSLPSVILAIISGRLASKSSRWCILTMALTSIASFAVIPLAGIIGIVVTIIMVVKVKGK